MITARLFGGPQDGASQTVSALTTLIVVPETLTVGGMRAKAIYRREGTSDIFRYEPPHAAQS